MSYGIEQTIKKRQIITDVKKTMQSYIKYKQLFIMFIPALIFYIVFRYAPLYGIIIAFKDYRFNLGILGSEWVGLENFIDLFSVPSFKEVFFNTIIISFYKLMLGFPAPIIFAILLNEVRNQRYKRIVQTVSYLPHFLSWVILGGIFIQFLSPSDGPINILLKQLGFKPIYFIADVKWFRSILVTTSIWKDFGWSSIVFLAALSGINPELYEAAEIDGANRLQRIIHVTLPALTPVITIMLIFAIGKLITDDFDQIFNLYNPAVYKVGDVLSTYTYRVGLVQMRYSYATAVGLFKNIISFTLVLSANAVTKRINEYGLW
jgi:putative aldouronate transport system permease protein